MPAEELANVPECTSKHILSSSIMAYNGYVHKRQMRRQHVPHNTHVQMKQGTHTLWFTRTNEAWNTYIVRVFILGEGKVKTNYRGVQSLVELEADKGKR